MRVPIENGLGLSTRVSDSIKLSAAYRNIFIRGLNNTLIVFQIDHWLFLRRRKKHGKHIYRGPGLQFSCDLFPSF
jgi:hypothetical protein